ncbi:unnamed protein product [Symbiodinium necroappetens]|uniref:Uncharacterized protein n=1 Tax=Symbiodinium necroappetens TaxID=1628268 RepID=A0A812NLH4_9DINO|nr:unnamed protein product [Symbiodinium necroappetens]
MTPTTPPPGAPPGTCGCQCCSQKRLEASMFRSCRRSAMLTQRLLRRLRFAATESLLSRPSGPSIPKGPGDRWKIPPNYEVAR